LAVDVVNFPRRAWDRRNQRWGDYVERAALLVALVFIFVGFHQIATARDQAVRTALERACNEQNVRHDRTVAKLDELVVGISDPVRRARAEQNRAGTVALIDALAPKRQCAARARQLTK
jgi:hypothetical protein